jgi:AcrR family transcriptional regulator
MPKLKDENKVKDIHAAALSILLKTGFSGLKMAEVAAEAGIATGTLYIYYKSKEELINAVFKQTKAEAIAAFLNPKHATGNFYSTFKNMWYAYFRFCADHPQKMIFVEQYIYSGVIAPELVNELEQEQLPLNQFLEYGQQNRILKMLDLELIKAQLQGSIHEVVKTSTRLNKPLSDSELDLLFSIAWDGLKRTQIY